MSEEEFANMFERYVKSPRGIQFLNNYLSSVLYHSNIETEESECLGMIYSISLPFNINDMVSTDINK